VVSITLFNLGTALYAIAAYLYLADWLAGFRQARRWIRWALFGVVLLHAGAVIGRSIEYGFPFLTLREVLSIYAWALALLCLILELRFGYTIIGVLVTPFGVSLILFATFLPAAQQPLLAMLQSPWLMAHVGVFFSAYAAFTMAFAAALAYLLQERALRKKQLSLRLPPLLVMDALCRWLVTVGILLMSAAMITGSIWAERVWNTPWVWEPKQVLCLITLGIYGLYYFVRHVARWSARRASWLVAIGFVSVLTTFIGADLLASNALHTFLFP